MIKSLDSVSPTKTTAHSKGNTWRKRCPEPVDVTLYQWRDDDRRRVVLKFSIMPAKPIRFRCTGTFTNEHPQRFRVQLARALDEMPELEPRELKQLGSVLELAIGDALGVEIATISPDVIDVYAV